MCLILFAYETHPDYRLVLAANRDEFYDRPAAPMQYWAHRPHILAGRDLQASGTWMGVTVHGKFAAITNYREPQNHNPSAPSRGGLVSDYLDGTMPPGPYVESVAAAGARFNGFNMIAGDLSALYYYSNRSGHPTRLEPGVYGLSNRLLNTPWPKIVFGRKRLSSLIETNPAGFAAPLLDLLTDQRPASDDQLPDTGVGTAMEKMLSPIFITSESYGTRCSTILSVDRHGRLSIAEYTWKPAQPAPTLQETRSFDFTLAGN